jgi:hypothetical protein
MAKVRTSWKHGSNALDTYVETDSGGGDPTEHILYFAPPVLDVKAPLNRLSTSWETTCGTKTQTTDRDTGASETTPDFRARHNTLTFAKVNTEANNGCPPVT